MLRKRTPTPDGFMDRLGFIVTGETDLAYEMRWSANEK